MIRPTREKAFGVACSLGLTGGRARLPDRVVVVSPHLDDAILSLGAAISHASRHGAQVTIATVFAGDPDSDEPAGEWDRRAGFATAGEAARARREEDARACALVGATPVWLPFGDLQYADGGGDAIVASVAAAAGGEPLLLPGFPLIHDDHRRIRRLLDEPLARQIAGVYTEQPYAAAWTGAPFAGPTPAPGLTPEPEAWRPLRAGLRDRRRKLAAVAAYASQLPLLGPVSRATLRYELRVGGETAAWKDGR
jgi:LmbE family N-acetylglucosaminyl deacetylase